MMRPLRKGAWLSLIRNIFFIAILIHQAVVGVAFQANRKNYRFVGQVHPIHSSSFTFTRALRNVALGDQSDQDNDEGLSSSTSAQFALDPDSLDAQRIVQENLGLSKSQHLQLKNLANLIVDWNERINLVSRKDCNVEVVFGRHILPCLAPLALENPVILGDSSSDNQRVVDVGTGGGFPGLPLAIAYPSVKFLLVDSVGKKLGAVRDMAKELGLNNVKTHHGRAEELGGPTEKFDVCVGRSVAAIPKYCAWIQHLLKDKDGKLLYIIGGDIEEEIVDRTVFDANIDQLLDFPGSSDKQLLVFTQANVLAIAKESGEKLYSSRSTTASAHTRKGKQTKKAKGEWTKRDSSVPKQRGYETFKRYDSTSSS